MPHELAAMTWEEISGLDRARAVPILPLGAIEAHGPHLPLDTDVVIALAMARAGAERLERHGLLPLILPPLEFTPAAFAEDFPGTLSVRGETLTAMLVDIGRSLARHGFGTLVLANSHFDPTNLGAIRDAVAALAGTIRAIFPDLTRRSLASRLTEEFQSGACHAGQYEGSIVLAEAPERVRETRRTALPPNPTSLSAAIKAGQQSFKEAGGSEAYFGTPAAATAEEGRATVAVLGDILAEAVVEALGARN